MLKEKQKKKSNQKIKYIVGIGAEDLVPADFADADIVNTISFSVATTKHALTMRNLTR